MLFDTVISPYWCDLNLNIEETVQALLEFYNCNKKVKSKIDNEMAEQEKKLKDSQNQIAN